MLASILGSAAVAVLLLSIGGIRRRERRRDSIARFADARKAMSVTQGRQVVRDPVTPFPPDADAPPDVDAPPGVVVRSGTATLFDPMARRGVDQARKSFRSDPEVLARRPTVAMLPTLLTSRSEAS